MLRGFMSTTVTFWPTNLQKVLPHLHIEAEFSHAKHTQQSFRTSKHSSRQVSIPWLVLVAAAEDPKQKKHMCRHGSLHATTNGQLTWRL